MDVFDVIEFMVDNPDQVTLKNVGRGARVVGKMTADNIVKVVEGAKSVEEQFNAGLVRTIQGLNFLDTDRQIEIAGENEAFVAVLETGVRSIGKGATNPIGLLVSGVVGGYMANYPPDALKKMVMSGVSDMALKQVGKKTIKTYVTGKLTERIIKIVVDSEVYKLLARKLSMTAGTAKTGVGIPIALLSFQGLLEEASKASRRMRKIDPILHNELRREPPSLGAQLRRLSLLSTPNAYRLQKKKKQLDPTYRCKRESAGLDMLYFLAEPQLKRYVLGIAYARKNKAAFQAWADFWS